MEKKKIVLTGERPTGPLHIGHYVGSLKSRVKIQNEGDYDEMYLFAADAQALTDNFDNPKKVRDNIFEVALDNLACGIDPKKVNYFGSIPHAKLSKATSKMLSVRSARTYGTYFLLYESCNSSKTSS